MKNMAGNELKQLKQHVESKQQVWAKMRKHSAKKRKMLEEKTYFNFNGLKTKYKD